MQAFTVLRGACAPMLQENIDTDAITPSAAGKSTSTDLGKMLFNNARYHLDGSEIPDFVLNQPRYRQSKILVAGRNFGCGSSRERAVWALLSFGIRCVIAPSFADIFNDNAFQNGLLPVVLPEEDCVRLAADIEAAADPSVTVDLQRLRVDGPTLSDLVFVISEERRAALLEGLDEISVILGMQNDNDAFEARDRAARPWIYGVDVHALAGRPA